MESSFRSVPKHLLCEHFAYRIRNGQLERRRLNVTFSLLVVGWKCHSFGSVTLVRVRLFSFPLPQFLLTIRESRVRYYSHTTSRDSTLGIRTNWLEILQTTESPSRTYHKDISKVSCRLYSNNVPCLYYVLIYVKDVDCYNLSRH